MIYLSLSCGETGNLTLRHLLLTIIAGARLGRPDEVSSFFGMAPTLRCRRLGILLPRDAGRGRLEW